MAIFNSFLYVYQIPGAMGRFDAPHWMEGSQASSCPPCQSIARTEELSWTPGVWRKCRGNMEEIWRKYAGIKSWLIPLSNLNFLPHFVKPLAWLDLRSVSETLNDVRDIEGTINMALILNLYRLSLVTQASAKLGHILRLFSLFKSCFAAPAFVSVKLTRFLGPSSAQALVRSCENLGCAMMHPNAFSSICVLLFDQRSGLDCQIQIGCCPVGYCDVVVLLALESPNQARTNKLDSDKFLPHSTCCNMFIWTISRNIIQYQQPEVLLSGANPL